MNFKKIEKLFKQFKAKLETSDHEDGGDKENSIYTV
jgi:hypothetical protein